MPTLRGDAYSVVIPRDQILVLEKLESPHKSATIVDLGEDRSTAEVLEARRRKILELKGRATIERTKCRVFHPGN